MMAHAAGIIGFQRQIQLIQNDLSIILNDFRQVQCAGSFQTFFQKLTEPFQNFKILQNLLANIRAGDFNHHFTAIMQGSRMHLSNRSCSQWLGIETRE